MSSEPTPVIFPRFLFIDPSTQPFGLGAMGGLPGMATLGMGSANFMEMQQRLSNQMMTQPDMLRSVMDSPLTQSLMANPEVMRGLIQSNPQMRQVKQTSILIPVILSLSPFYSTVADFRERGLLSENRP